MVSYKKTMKKNNPKKAKTMKNKKHPYLTREKTKHILIYFINVLQLKIKNILISQEKKQNIY